MLFNFACFLWSGDFVFPKSTFKKKSFRNTIRVSKSLDPDHVRHFVEFELDPNWLQRSPAVDTGGKRVNELLYGLF